MTADYASVQGLVKRTEVLFPLACFGSVKRDWDGIGDYLMSLEEWDK